MIKQALIVASLLIAFSIALEPIVSATAVTNGVILSNSFISGFISTANNNQNSSSVNSAYLCGFNSLNSTGNSTNNANNNSTNSYNSTSTFQVTGPITVTFSPCYTYSPNASNSGAQVFTLSQLLSLQLANLTDNIGNGSISSSLDNVVWNVTGPITYFQGTKDERVTVSFSTIMYLPVPASSTAAPAPVSTEAPSTAQATTSGPTTTENPSFIPPNSPIQAQPAPEPTTASAANYMNITYTFSLAVNDPLISITVAMTSPSLGLPSNVSYISVCYAVAEGVISQPLNTLTAAPGFGNYAGDAVLFTNATNVISALESGFAGFRAQPFWFEFVLNSTSTSAADRFSQHPAILRSANGLLQGNGSNSQPASAFCDVHTLWNGLLVHEYQIGVARQVTQSDIASIISSYQSTTASPSTTRSPSSTAAGTTAPTTTGSISRKSLHKLSKRLFN